MQIKVYKISEQENSSDKRIWVICDDSAKDSGNLSFLAKILSAVQLDLKQDTHFLVYNRQQPNINLSEVAKVDATTKILLFGVPPKQLGLHIQTMPYQLTTFRNMNIIWAETLSALLDDKNKKMKLWNSLKAMFERTT